MTPAGVAAAARAPGRGADQSQSWDPAPGPEASPREAAPRGSLPLHPTRNHYRPKPVTQALWWPACVTSSEAMAWGAPPHCRAMGYKVTLRVTVWGGCAPSFRTCNRIIHLPIHKSRNDVAFVPQRGHVRGWWPSLTGAGLRVAERLLRVQPQADVAPVGWGWI